MCTQIIIPGYIFLTAKRNATGHRWKIKLADSNLNLHYTRRGKTSIDVDFFSKFPRDIHQYTNTSTKEDTDKAVNSVVNQLDYTQAWLCSVNTVNSLQKEAQQLKQGTTLKQITDAMHRLTFRTSQERQQQGSYSIILSFDLAYQTEILNNQGGKLENHLFKELQQYLGVNP